MSTSRSYDGSTSPIDWDLTPQPLWTLAVLAGYLWGDPAGLGWADASHVLVIAGPVTSRVLGPVVHGGRNRRSTVTFLPMGADVSCDDAFDFCASGPGLRKAGFGPGDLSGKQDCAGAWMLMVFLKQWAQGLNPAFEMWAQPRPRCVAAACFQRVSIFSSGGRMSNALSEWCLKGEMSLNGIYNVFSLGRHRPTEGSHQAWMTPARLNIGIALHRPAIRARGIFTAGAPVGRRASDMADCDLGDIYSAKIRACGHRWDSDGRSAKTCQIDSHGPN